MHYTCLNSALERAVDSSYFLAGFHFNAIVLFSIYTKGNVDKR